MFAYLFDGAQRLAEEPQRSIILPNNDLEEGIINAQRVTFDTVPAKGLQALQDIVPDFVRFIVEVIEAYHNTRN